ncbi:zinc finger protein Rlf isoform X2 [Carettochelys insculpta]|uniref:zinc finger protein Rlf isoform X2 n=1 Tax=Carettochelys insculpta TaxID=44489 RepID=UPI003EBFAD9F
MSRFSKTVLDFHNVSFSGKMMISQAEEAGLAVSVLLCVRALQLRSNGNDEMKTSVCKTIACLLPMDLEVRRACQLTEFLLQPSLVGYNMLEELYLQPDQKFDEDDALVPNSLRCELLLALKAYWPFDPEFWDWKTLKRHCLKLLGKDASDSEDDASCNLSVNETDMLETLLSDCDETKDHKYYEGEKEAINQSKEKTRVKKPIGSSERYQRWLQYKFFCVLCKRECIEARILHHSKMHMEDGIYTCPVCTKKFKKKEIFVPHVMEHVKMPPSRTYRPKKKILLSEEISLQKTSTSRNPSASPEGKQHQPQPSEKNKNYIHDYVTFSQLENFHLQDRDIYPCPGTDCSRVFKQFKYLSVHLKAEHQNNDENAKHYLDMKNRREKCAYCRRHFMTSFHLKEHEKMHCGPQPYMCVSVGCYARFGSVNELLNHKQMHRDLRYKCELSGCSIVFSDLGQLYHHEAQHFRDASYTCNFLGCKKFYYSKTEFQNHLAVHNIAISNGEVKEVSVKFEEPVSKDKCNNLPESQLLHQTRNMSPQENLTLSMGSTSSQEILQIKEETISDNEETDSESNCSLYFGSHGTSALVTKKQVSPVIKTIDKNQTTPESLISHGGVFHSSGLKEQCTHVAVCFDGEKITCGFEGCNSTYKNVRGMKKHLQRAHPYHFKPKTKMGINARDIFSLLSDSHSSKTSGDLRHASDTNTDTPESVYCHRNSKVKNCLKEEVCSSADTAFYEGSKVPNTEDAMLDLLLGLKHLSLKSNFAANSSNLKHKPFLGSLQSYPFNDAKCLVNETTSELHFQEEQDNLPTQYLTQLAAKPFFCERQGCKYEFVTREALLMHYVKKHNYSKEKVLQLNMFQHRYSPFKCHICQRTFTRKTHLRIHYRNKHQIGIEKVTHKLFANEKCEHAGACAEGKLKYNAASAPGFFTNKNEEHAEKTEQSAEQVCHLKKEECSSETDLDSSEDTDSNVTGKHTQMSSVNSHREELEAREGRGSKRTVAKGNLCYILHKYHKPFHCIHKSCNSAFTNQKGLIRHYRTVHQYNKEQLCLEKDKARTKRELVKCKKIFACKYKECSKRFLCSKALAKHCSDFHSLDPLEDQKILSETESARFRCNQPQCPAVFHTFNKLKHHLIEQHANGEEIKKDFEIHCDLNGCDRIFTNYSHYSQHVHFRHSEYYDSLFGNHKEEQDNLLNDKNKEDCLKGQYGLNENEKRVKENAKKIDKNKEKHLINFKTKEEALKMCREKSNQTQYPCMVQGCLSVVKLESSIVRHYKRTHQMTSIYIEQQTEKLVVCVKSGTMIKKKSSSEKELLLNKEEARDFKKNTVQMDSLQENEKQCVPNPVYDHEDTGSENQNRSAANGADFDTGAFMYSGTVKYNHSSKTSSFEHCSITNPLSKTEGFPESRENSSYFTSLPLQLPREKETEGWQYSSVHQTAKKNPLHTTRNKFQKNSLSRPFDLKTYKPMGFESSFLKFIQESEEKDDDDDDDDNLDEWECPEQLEIDGVLQKDRDLQRGLKVGNFVCENTEVSISQNHESAVHGQLTEIQPLLSTVPTSVPSLENLRAILDKALTDCGDLALKQLHYLRPVVVLERSKFSPPLIDLFPTKKSDELCVGST